MSFSEMDKKTLNEEVNRIFADFLHDGFTASSVKSNESSILGEFLVITLNNTTGTRQLSFHLLRAELTNREALTVFFNKPPRDTFTLREFLKIHRLMLLDLDSYKGTFRERLTAHLQDIRTLINEHLRGVLEGKAWPNIPMDWGDYR